MTDAELATLYAKVEELTLERNAALELAEEIRKKLQAVRTERDHYRTLWLAAAQPSWWRRLLIKVKS